MLCRPQLTCHQLKFYQPIVCLLLVLVPVLLLLFLLLLVTFFLLHHHQIFFFRSFVRSFFLSFSRFFIIYWLLSLYSPQESEKDGALLTAEVLIECLRESQTNVVTRLRDEIATGTTIFNSKYFEIQYTGEQASSF